MAGEPHNATVTYPGGLRARWRWAGSGQGGGGLRVDRGRGLAARLGTRVSTDPDALCRAEIRLEGPRGRVDRTLRIDDLRRAGRARLGYRRLLVVKYGFHTFGLDAAAGRASLGAPSAVAGDRPLGSSRLPHVLVQTEIETFAIEADGTVAWRVAHSDVVTAAELVGGRLVLTSFDGLVVALDPELGATA
jgi:hypothetical protein